MATIKPFNQGALDSLKKQQSGVETSLAKSNTAYAGDTTPTSIDVANDLKLTNLKAQIRQMQGQQLKEDWYGKQTATATGSDEVQPEKEGILIRALTNLQKPLYGVVGATESLFGQGAKPTLKENVEENMKTGHRTFGDLIKKTGAPGWVSAPLGFAADILLDPVNIMTLGTESLVGKVGAGAVRGAKRGGVSAGLEAAKTGFTSGLGKDVLGLAEYIPRLPYMETKISKLPAFERASQKVYSQAQRYNMLTGVTDPIADKVSKGILNTPASMAGYDDLFTSKGITLGSYLEDKIRQLPRGAEIIEKFKYDPYNWTQIAKLKDRVIKILAKGDDLSSIEADAGSLLGKTPVGKFEPGSSMEKTALQQRLKAGLDDADYIAQQGADSAIHTDNIDQFSRLMEEEGAKEGIAKAEIQKYLRMNNQKNKTGMQFYDNLAEKVGDKMKSIKSGEQAEHGFNVGDFIKKEGNNFVKTDDVAKSIGTVTEIPNLNNFKYEKVDALKIPIKNFKTGEKSFIKPGVALLEAIDFATKFFKTAKVPMNVASHTNAVVGNVVMSAMAGWDVSKTVPMTAKAYKFLSGKAGAKFIVDNFLQEGSDFAKFVAAHPTTFKGTFGWNPSMLGGRRFLDQMLNDGRAVGLVTAKNEAEVIEAIKNMPNEFRSYLENIAENEGAKKGTLISDIQDLIKGKGDAKQLTPSKMVELEGVEAAGNPSSMIRDLDLEGGAGMDYIKKKAEEGNVAYKLLQGAMDKASSVFEMHDQAAKLGNALHATSEGLTLEELRKLSRMVPEGITRADITGEKLVAGQKRYFLTWDKATDLANETHMNYSAMPAFVRMMRSVPILGAPFVSFTYAAIPKALKTIYHNPAVFNDIQFLKSELEGDKSPAELKNMENKYSQWFKSPAMFRVPFFNEHPAYVNLANMLPYYSLSVTNPSQRSYEKVLPNAIVQAVDKLQLFKDPAGQVIFDYFIMPMLLSEQERPLSQFGQPLYPESANGIKKLGYAARSLGEAFVPPTAAGLAGLVGGEVAPGVTPYIPSYSYRKLANAMDQKTPLGIPSKDSSSELVMRGLAGLAGLQYNNMDLTYLQNQSKKKK